ncbi:MarR family transcriptional regulator [Subtercola sp. Z020]|uniref:MarR family winged helix-turn-helix transcriptional regulator n=1 Tax=Subtercola sp. Z020 TaxID=2080582 RepID=UPI000CE7A901|nr:MarR family transcriptional regulator [Subtercola sp. Z020]PPF88271.1 MarR family transcriptional regulator [Subtercola sp. Z020]
MNSELSTLLGDLVSVTHRLTRLAAQATGESTSPAAWRTLSVLTSAGPMRIGELANASRVSQPTMTKIVANLNELEWIKRIADSSDARAWQIAIAPKGQNALNDWRYRLGAALEPLFSDLTHRELEVLAEATDLIGDRIDVQELAA